jgi:hypothetical protein
MPDAALPVASDPIPIPQDIPAPALRAPLRALTGLAGVSTFTLAFGPYRDVAGTALCVGASGRLVAVDGEGKLLTLSHPATGTVLLPAPVPISIDTSGGAVLAGLPFTDSAALRPVGFLYRVQWDIPVGRPTPPTKTFAVPTSAGATVDYDLVTGT